MSWFETACGFMPRAFAMSVTVASPLRTMWWSMRMRVSLASTLKRAMTLTASTNERSGRSASGDREQQGLSAGVDGFRVMSFVLLIKYYTVSCIRDKREAKNPNFEREGGKTTTARPSEL